ncbi:MAG: DUF2207 domain-containing protein [Gammaproteobacteria bacterium]|nr:DUF2207 domain-containing protein [Gammaproteobacteria bacterium]
MTRRVLLLVLLAASTATADERILSYHSDILIRTDGWIEVSETIRVRAEDNQIRRGIFRDYPTDYEDQFGNDFEVLYEPRSVTRDGQPEPFFSEEGRNGVRTYFGSSDRFLAPGEYTYVYRYDAGRMIGFFEDMDELWWNVTGNGWAFPMDEASATVTFEFDVDPGLLQVNAWQGPLGSKTNAVAEIDRQGLPTFAATRTLFQGDGLTLSVRWPKGLVAEPSDVQRFVWLLSDNINLLAALAGLAAMLGYYIPVWKGHGKDPTPGIIITRYEPPDSFSPASLRYIDNMGYDNETMTAGVISLAVKGYLRVNAGDEHHSLKETDPGEHPPPLATGEKALYDALFKESSRVTLIDENHEIIGGAKKAHENSLKRDYHKRYFVTNGLLNLPALLIGIVAAAVALRIGPSFLVVATIGLMIATLIFFAIILKRPTKAGRDLLDESLGFREYLEIAEKDEMNLRNPPEKTPALFEQYLPFALALGVEQQWAERFTRMFAALEGPNDTTWHPSWYNGSWSNMDLSMTTSSMSSSLGSAISSSSTPPGSSSSGGGGGFSGGGGGGGGGGGW